MLYVCYRSEFRKYNDLYKDSEDEFSQLIDEKTTEFRYISLHGFEFNLFSQFSSQMQSLGLMYIVEEILTEMLFKEISRKIVRFEDTSESALETAVLPWLQNVLFPFLQIIFTSKGMTIMFLILTKPESMKIWKSRFEYYTYETFAEFRISQMFDIIVDYPDR